nr:hypothetical protein GCM10020063_056390 [Dactylosporangium thailandense]
MFIPARAVFPRLSVRLPPVSRPSPARLPVRLPSVSGPSSAPSSALSSAFLAARRNARLYREMSKRFEVNISVFVLDELAGQSPCPGALRRAAFERFSGGA